MELCHKYFVQYMLKHGFKPIEIALEFCRTASKGHIGDIPKLKMMIVEINRGISKQNFKIIVATCEVTSQGIVIFLNTRNDDISKLQLGFAALDLEYFHAILQELVNSSTHRMSYVSALNVTSNLTARYTRDDGQNALTRWFKGGYFVKISDYIYLGPKSIFEFTSYLKSHCPEQICYLCSELVFTGRQCEQCDKIFHSYCLEKYFERQASCPHCKNEWIEAAAEESTRYSHQQPQTQYTQEDEDETSHFQQDTSSQVDYSEENQYEDTDGSSMVLENLHDNPQPSTSWGRATPDFTRERSKKAPNGRKRKSSKN